jgi:hypothetical protein
LSEYRLSPVDGVEPKNSGYGDQHCMGLNN